MTSTLWLIGEGQLFERVVQRFDSGSEPAIAGRVIAVPTVDDATITAEDTVIVARNGWEPERDIAEQDAIRAVTRMLPLRIVGDLGIVGPWVEPDQPGCQVCAERRRHLWRRQNFSSEQLSGPVPSVTLTSAHLDHVTEVGLHVLDQDLLQEREVYVSTKHLTGQIHTMVPLPTCPGCSNVPEDSPELARVDMDPRPQPDPEAFRGNVSGLSGDELRTMLHDWRYGPVGHIFRSENSVMALTTAEVALTSGNPGEGGHGRAPTYHQGETIALYEALERLDSSTPQGKRTVVKGSQNSLADAVDLSELGLHPLESYDHAKFAFTPYDPDLEIDWIWGWKMGEEKPVLLPEHVAYWNLDHLDRPGGHPTRFLYESSNGCALGSSLEEASLYGIFEVIERDAFLLTWYTQRSPTPLHVTDEEVPLLRGMRALLNKLDYDLLLFDITTEMEIPAVMSVVVRRDDNGPVAFFAAGAHCDPRRAVAAAAIEVVTNAVVRYRMPADMRQDQEFEGRRMLEDPTTVMTLHDHSILYTFPETRSWWTFLDRTKPATTIEEAWGDWKERWLRDDLTDVLREAVSVLTANGMDPIVVNQTDRVLTGPVPHTVKVIVPQAIPMTFGHVHRRTRNLRRLHELPVQLGYRQPHEQPIDPDKTPPHPFP